ncbi:MAG: hypothetical protein ACLTYP_07275 [Eubacterium sp.]
MENPAGCEEARKEKAGKPTPFVVENRERGGKPGRLRRSKKRKSR